MYLVAPVLMFFYGNVLFRDSVELVLVIGT